MKIMVSVPEHSEITLYFDWQKGKPVEFLQAVIMKPAMTLTLSANLQITSVRYPGLLFGAGTFSADDLTKVQTQIKELLNELLDNNEGANL